MAKVCILGGGSWGIGLSVVLHKNGHEVTVWSAVPAEIQMLQEKHEHKMLPGVKLSEDMIFTTDVYSCIFCVSFPVIIFLAIQIPPVF